MVQTLSFEELFKGFTLNYGHDCLNFRSWSDRLPGYLVLCCPRRTQIQT
jgi:hypothetical protein